MRAHRLPALRVVVLLVGLVTGVSLAESRHEARQLKVGVVDLAAVFRKYDRTRGRALTTPDDSPSTRRFAEDPL